jgi:hypothetical protein
LVGEISMTRHGTVGGKGGTGATPIRRRFIWVENHAHNSLCAAPRATLPMYS